METVGVALVVFGPLAAILALLYASIRRHRPAPLVERRPPRPRPRPGDPAGDREPRRPLVPSRSGAARVEVPAADDEPAEARPLPLTGRGRGPETGPEPGHRLAG